MKNIKEQDIFSLISRYRPQIMGFAALWIIVFHVWIPVFPNVPKLWLVEHFIKRIGFCGVDIFFFLSGMGLVFSVEKTTVPVFWYKRIKRLVLPALMIAFIHLFFGDWTVKHFIKAVTGYSFYFETIYTFLWFIPAIIHFYLIFPLYYKILKKFRNPAVFTLIVLEIWLWLSIAGRKIIRDDMYGFTNRIPVFIIGILFACISKNKKISCNRETGLLVLSTCMVGAYLAYLTNYMDMFLIVPCSNAFLPNLLLTVSICPIVAYMCSRIKILAGFLGFWGSFTLEFYCIQEVLASYIMESLSASLPVIAANIVFIAIASAIGYAVYKVNTYIWKPIDRFVLKG